MPKKLLMDDQGGEKVTIPELNRANEIQQEIKELDNFIFTAERVWKGKLIHETTKLIFKTIPYGFLESKEYTLNTEIKNEVLEFLKVKLIKLNKELDQLGKVKE